MYDFRTAPVRFGPVAWGVRLENTTAEPARTSHGTASGASSRQRQPSGVIQWRSVPSRCRPGTIHGQPLSSVASVSAIHTVR
jgi:hypothetical protein